MNDRTLPWWRVHLKGVKVVDDGITALCPAHDDKNNSLHVTKNGSNTVLVHCFANCKYEDILRSAEGPRKEKVEDEVSTTLLSPQDWWVDYTGVSWDVWENLGTEATKKDIVFTFGFSDVIKKRHAGSKGFAWDPPKSAAPTLWPSVPEELPEEIWISEGESDCGVLRSLGFTAFALTKGVGTPIPTGLFQALKHRGVKNITLSLDIDESGSKASDELIKIIAKAGIKVCRARLEEVLDIFLGEKDIRDFFLRVRDQKKCFDLLKKSAHAVDEGQSNRLILNDFLQMTFQEERWCVEKVWLEGSVGMIVGAPKMGKSWLALDLGLSIASGTPYLGSFKVLNPGPVVYIPKEDPPPIIYDRVAKVAVAKGFGGSFNGKVLKLPSGLTIPFYLDLSKGFSFNDESTLELMSWLHEIYEVHGRIAMVILDPILRMIEGVDEFKATDIGNSVFKTAGQIQNTFGSAVTLVHHRNKSSETDKNSYGSMAFHAFSEGTLYIDGNDSDAEGWRQVRGEYKSAEETKWAYRFPELDVEYRVETDESGVHQELKPTDFQVQVLNEIKRYREGTTVEELTKVLDGPPSYKIRNVLTVLAEAKLIVRIPKATKQGASQKGPAKDLWRARD